MPSENVPPDPGPRPMPGLSPRLSSLISWMVILALTAWLVVQANMPEERGSDSSPSGVSTSTELTGKFLVALRDAKVASNQFLLAQARSSERGPLPDRLALLILRAELGDEAGSLESLQAIRDEFTNLEPDEPSNNVEEVTTSPLETIDDLIQHYQWIVEPASTPPLSDSQRDELINKLEWFGRLALVHARADDPDGRTALLRSVQHMPYVLGGYLFWLLLAGTAGLVVLIILCVLAFQRRVKSGMGSATTRGYLYAETFALWLLIFTGSRELLHLAARSIHFDTNASLLLNVAIMFFSLVALLWPILRGVPLRVLREDIGLTLGRRPATEVGAGVATYTIAIFLLGIGVVFLILLQLLQRIIQPDAGEPSHPAQQAIVGADWSTTLLILFLGCVAAPIVEEIMFRGVFYRHLRDASHRWHFLASFAFSALISSFLFAAIHPQGWTTIPVLMALAVAFCIGREWRGSLLPGMAAHAIQNGLTLLLSVALFNLGA